MAHHAGFAVGHHGGFGAGHHAAGHHAGFHHSHHAVSHTVHHVSDHHAHHHVPRGAQHRVDNRHGHHGRHLDPACAPHRHHHNHRTPWESPADFASAVAVVHSFPMEETAKRQTVAPQRSELVVVGGGTVNGQAMDTGSISVTLPANGVDSCLGVTFFAVDVLPSDGSAAWRVMRRYSHFRALADSRSRRSVRAPMPRKHIRACVGARLEARRADLELWLQQALAGAAQPDAYLNRFLVLGRSAIPRPHAAEQRPAPSAPSLEHCSNGTCPPLEQFRITLPAGASAESLIAVVIPGGGRVLISVPWGVCPGSTLDLWLDPVAGTLSVSDQQDWQALRMK